MNLHDSIRRVVDAGNCVGCGACSMLWDHIEMVQNEAGYIRPVETKGCTETAKSAELFQAMCPGASYKRPKSGPISIGEHLGTAFGYWSAYAEDHQLRFKGSSGGALSAIQLYLLESSAIEASVAVKQDPDEPQKTTTSISKNASDIEAASGSRYAPSSSLAGVNLFLNNDSIAVTGKPCEIAALRTASESLGDEAQHTLMSFFCAGTPSQHATGKLKEDLVGADKISRLAYRGNGWPGRFQVETEDGRSPSLSYAESWGKTLGRAVEDRCKICPDGVGESADIVAADYWHADEIGWPSFDDRPGVSLLIARTEKGKTIVEAAANAGYLVLQDCDLSDLENVQRYQVQRRVELPGRLLGRVLRKVPIPKYENYELVRTFLRHPIINAKACKGSFERSAGSKIGLVRAFSGEV